MPDLFPTLVISELLRRNLLSPVKKTYAYAVGCTPHGTERMVVYDQHGWPVAICSWAYGARLSRLVHAAQIVRDLASEYTVLCPMVSEILLAESIGSRFVVVAPWYRGTMLSNTFSSVGERMRALDAAFDVLMLLHKTTLGSHRFSEQDYQAYVAQPIDTLASSVVVPNPQREHLASLAHRLRTLIGEVIPSCVFHGDFELGNLLCERQGGIRVLDWELSQRYGLCFMDLAHLLVRFGVQCLGLSYSASAVQIFGVKNDLQAWSTPYQRKYADAIGIGQHVVRRLAALTILHDAANYLVRVPFLLQPDFWADYVDAATWLLSDED